MILLIASVLAQGADAITMDLAREANPIVLMLGPSAYLAKIALIVGVTALAWSLPRLRTRWPRLRSAAACAVGGASLGIGLIGAVSNLI